MLEAFRKGEFDGVEVVNEIAEREFFHFLRTEKLLQELAQSYPSPRVKEEVPVWFYLASDLALRLHGRNSFHSYPYVVASGGLLSLLSPKQAQHRVDPVNGDHHLQCEGFNDKNHYDRKTPCDADFLRKMARDTKPDKLESWLAQAAPANNTRTIVQNITLNQVSYKDGRPSDAGIGAGFFNNEFVARFDTPASTQIDSVTADFPFFLSGSSYKVSIRQDDGLGRPGAQVYIDASSRSADPGNQSIRLSSPLIIPAGPFYVGLIQGNTDLPLGFNYEYPLRPGAFFVLNGGEFVDLGTVGGANYKLNLGAVLGDCKAHMSVDVTPDSGSVCGAGSITFTANTANATGKLSYQWTQNGVNINGAFLRTRTVTKSSAGTFTYNCKVTDDSGCIDITDPVSATGVWATTSPAETNGLAFSPNRQTLSWSPVPFGARYDVVRGSVSSLPVGPGGGDETCIPNVAGTSTSDATIPPAGGAFWYVVRGKNACGSENYGSQSNGDVDYHSGEPFDGTDWAATVGASSVTWSTTPYAANANANALRWGTLYNFRFDADVVPGAQIVTIGLFRPGQPASVAAPTITPVCVQDGACEPYETSCTCGADCGAPHATEFPCAGGTDEDCDGLVDCADPDCCTDLGCPGNDADGDGSLGCVNDCDDANAQVWATPGEARNLLITKTGPGGTIQLGWEPPTDTGGTVWAYDLLRSYPPFDFYVAFCMTCSSPSAPICTDEENPGVGSLFVYLVRARNDCPSGEGVITTDSNGNHPIARTCR